MSIKLKMKVFFFTFMEDLNTLSELIYERRTHKVQLQQVQNPTIFTQFKVNACFFNLAAQWFSG